MYELFTLLVFIITFTLYEGVDPKKMTDGRNDLRKVLDIESI